MPEGYAQDGNSQHAPERDCRSPEQANEEHQSQPPLKQQVSRAGKGTFPEVFGQARGWGDLIIGFVGAEGGPVGAPFKRPDHEDDIYGAAQQPFNANLLPVQGGAFALDLPPCFFLVGVCLYRGL